MQSRSLRGEELADRCVRAERLKELNVALADLEQDGFHTLLLDDLTMLIAHLEALVVELDCGIEIFHCHAYVVDAVEHGSAGYSTFSRRGFGRYSRPTFAHACPSNTTMSEVKPLSPRRSDEPTP